MYYTQLFNYVSFFMLESPLFLYLGYLMDFISAIILGIVEGLTEFLPISSTGHLILASELLGIEQDTFHKTFEVVIQLGAILAVLFVFLKKLFTEGISLWIKLILGFLPAGALGFLLYPYIKNLFSPIVVSIMLIVGGVAFIVIELLYKDKNHTAKSTLDISYKNAFIIGFFQALAMIPGTSRSGSTIIGGLLLGCDRKTAAEFSFLLALPTMIVASLYSIYKSHEVLNMDNLTILLVGFIAAFFSALLAVKVFLKFISRFNFIPFGVYRIILGIVFLFYIY